MADLSHAAPAPLSGDYRVEPGGNSVSGLSSGAFMAVQLHLAHSACFIGAGVIAGGPYRCAESFPAAAFTAEDAWILNAAYICMSPLTRAAGPDFRRSLELARETAGRKIIDPLDGVRGQRVYVFTGRNDAVVRSTTVEATRDFYQALGADIDFHGDQPAGHAILTSNAWDQEIGQNRPPYINNSSYGGAAAYMQSHEILRHIYGKDRNPPAESLSGRLVSFDQSEFFGGRDDQAGMGKIGFVYVPAAVERKERPARGVHICLHGCKQAYSFVDFVNGRRDRANRTPFGRRYAISTGYNAWADANDLIVLYPQVQARDDEVIQNPDGCWDWWGYCGGDGAALDYYSQQAAQISALYRMLKKVCGKALSAQPRKAA